MSAPTFSRFARSTLPLLTLVASCAGTSPPSSVPVAPAVAPTAPAANVAPAAPRAEKRVIVVLSRRSGTFVTTSAPGQPLHMTFDQVENGRGPHVDATMRLDADGTITAFEASGTHELGTKVAESFARSGTHARWHSEEESGEREVDGPALFVPMADLPVDGLIVRAALAAGGTIPLLPAGEARVRKVSEIEVHVGGQTRKLIGYQIDGLALGPRYTWMNEDQTWFGSARPWFSVVPEGWEAAVEPLVARRIELLRARDAELAAASAHHPPAAGLAYTHARILDVERGRFIADQTVVIVGDKIAAVGPSAKLAVPAGAEVIDLHGRALLPGLIDMHSHLDTNDGPLNIASGVTTVRDVGNDPDLVDDYKQRFDAGTAVGPHVVRFGFVEGRNEKAASSRVTAETVAEAEAAVEFFAKRGYEGIKIYNSVRPELVPIITAAAHKRGMLVTGHVPVHMLANEVVRAGYDGIEHINMLLLNFFATHDTDTRDTTRFTLVGDQAASFDLDGKPCRDFIELLRLHKTVVDPTLDAFEDLFVGIPGRVLPGLEATVARLPVQTGRDFLLGGLPLPGNTHATYLKSWDKMLLLVKRLHEAKIHLVVGTDHINGLMLHHEMALYVRAGISPADVLRMATIEAARALGLERQIGSIARNKRADLVVVDGDPLADIRALGRVVSTMRGGVLHASQPLYDAVGVLPYARD